MSKKTIFSLITIFIFGAVLYFFLNMDYVKKEKDLVFDHSITIGNQTLSVFIADTNESRNRGLSDSKNMANGQGMLFVFDVPSTPHFWMKDMNYPMDIIWINSDRKIIGVEQGVDPDTYPKTFSPQEPVVYALEVPVGFYYISGLKIGDVLSF